MNERARKGLKETLESLLEDLVGEDDFEERITTCQVVKLCYNRIDEELKEAKKEIEELKKERELVHQAIVRLSDQIVNMPR